MAHIQTVQQRIYDRLTELAPGFLLAREDSLFVAAPRLDNDLAISFRVLSIVSGQMKVELIDDNGAGTALVFEVDSAQKSAQVIQSGEMFSCRVFPGRAGNVRAVNWLQHLLSFSVQFKAVDLAAVAI